MIQPLVSIIIPVYNGEKFIGKALNSIISQSYKNIELIVIDGSSTDKTLKILEKYDQYISLLVSEQDDGMYNAINKGLVRAKGEILCWLNSDDMYFSFAIQNVVETFNTFSDVEWITGRKVVINQNDQIIKIGCFRSFDSFFIRKGFYRHDAFGFITQESTFWKRSLLEKAGILNENLKLASDFELWTRFANHSKLFSLNTTLAAFRSHEGQMSSDIQRYTNECDIIKPIKYKSVIRLIGKVYYLFSMISPKNKIIISKHGLMKKIKKWNLFE